MYLIQKIHKTTFAESDKHAAIASFGFEMASQNQPFICFKFEFLKSIYFLSHYMMIMDRVVKVPVCN